MFQLPSVIFERVGNALYPMMEQRQQKISVTDIIQLLCNHHAPGQFVKDACAVYLRRPFFLHNNNFSKSGPTARMRLGLKVAAQLPIVDTPSESPSLTTSVSGLGEVSAAKNVLFFLLCDFDVICVLCLESVKKKIERQNRIVNRQGNFRERIRANTG